MVYELCRITTRFYLKTFRQWTISGLENVPKEGGIIVASNHSSNLDPVIIGSALERKIHYLAKEELFRMPLLSWLIKRLGAFPIKRGAGDRGAIRESLKLLNQGLAYGIFPEGTRSKTGQLQEAKVGAAMLAVKAEVPIVPVGIIGAPKGKITIKVGEPMDLQEYFGKKVKKEELQEISEHLMHRIAELIDQK